MDKNRIGLLTGALLALLLIAWLGGAFNSAPSTLEVPDLRLADADITAVTIEQNGETSTAEHSSGMWQLTAPMETLADSTVVTRFIESVQAIELSEVVSTNPERYAKFGVDSTAAQVRVTTAGGDDTAMFVGRQGNDFRSVYVRLANDPRVFLTTERLTLPTDFSTWRDKTIFAIDPSAVQSASVMTPEHSYMLSATPQGWQVDGAAADSASVMQWLLRFAPVNADGFVSEADVEPIRTDATHRIAITQTDGTTFSLAMVDQSGSFGAVQPGSADVYRINTFRLTTLAPDPSSLTPSP
ncbi:MAG: DUF4340 domain-containing protein [Bacteroidota bacterium]